MEELSIEQKATAYDKAIEKIQKYVKDEYGCTRLRPEDIFPELKEEEDEKIRKEIMRIVDGYFPDKASTQREKYIAWLEKQGEQKHADNIEPKFKVGNWEVLNENHNSIYQVEKIENYHYILRHILGGAFSDPFGLEGLMRLWTIQDAKNGDVIYEKSTESIILFKSEDCGWIDSHCSYWQKMKAFECGERQYGRVSGMNICPATKEQRDLLLAKMKEAGYGWYAEKKQVIKL